MSQYRYMIYTPHYDNWLSRIIADGIEIAIAGWRAVWLRFFVCQRRGCLVLLSATGAIAQLGERLHGMQEVAGSIPTGSITFPLCGFPVWSRKSP